MPKFRYVVNVQSAQHLVFDDKRLDAYRVAVHLELSIHAAVKLPIFIDLAGHQGSAKLFGNTLSGYNAFFFYIIVVIAGDGKLDLFSIVKCGITIAVIPPVLNLINNTNIIYFTGLNAKRLCIINEKWTFFSACSGSDRDDIVFSNRCLVPALVSHLTSPLRF